ncbi:MAG: hypothetical protein NVSMB65_10400 [Chloroflexota bacterium]
MAITGEPRAGTHPWIWLADDTEESILGTIRHQDAIAALARMLRLLREQQGGTWGAGTQIGIEGFTRPDGTAYAPMPDVFVHPRPIPEDVTSITLAAYGPPWLIVEVASPSTVAADLGEKARTYARGGVLEYLVFDVDARLVPGQVRAWRLSREGEGGLTPWAPEADGRWHSAHVPLALAPEGVLLRVYDRAGRVVPTDTEERQRREHAEWEARQEARRRQEAEQRAQEAEQRAEEEARRREKAEVRLAEFEAELRRRQGQDG